MLTQERLKELLHYSKDTGVFTWVVDRARMKAGMRAGYINKIGYECIVVDGIRYLSHRLAWIYVNGRFPSEQIDHINRDRSDNRILNLREANAAQNRINTTHSRNTSGRLGVRKHGRRWRADIKINGKNRFLGSFFDFESAVNARAEAENEIDKSFRPNITGD